MKITVKQLKQLIREAVEEAVEEKDKLVGDQKKLDVAPPFGKLDKHDFKRLGARSKAKTKKPGKLEEAMEDESKVDAAIEDAVEYARSHMTTKKMAFDKFVRPVLSDSDSEDEIRKRFYNKLHNDF